jgi:DivIVA domain-containing protein
VLTLVGFALLAIVLAAGLFLLAAYLLPAGEQIAPPLRDEPVWEPPTRPLSAEDIAAARLPVALRGYRFAETDRLLDRLAEELDRRDAEIAQLRGREDEKQERLSWAPPTAAPRSDAESDGD